MLKFGPKSHPIAIGSQVRFSDFTAGRVARGLPRRGGSSPLRKKYKSLIDWADGHFSLHTMKFQITSRPVAPYIYAVLYDCSILSCIMENSNSE